MATRPQQHSSCKRRQIMCNIHRTETACWDWPLAPAPSSLHVFVFGCRKFVILPVSGTKLALVRMWVWECVFSQSGLREGGATAWLPGLPLTSSAARDGVLLAFLLPVCSCMRFLLLPLPLWPEAVFAAMPVYVCGVCVVCGRICYGVSVCFICATLATAAINHCDSFSHHSHRTKRQ